MENRLILRHSMDSRIEPQNQRTAQLPPSIVHALSDLCSVCLNHSPENFKWYFGNLLKKFCWYWDPFTETISLWEQSKHKFNSKQTEVDPYNWPTTSKPQLSRLYWGVSLRWSLHDDVIKWKHFPRYWPFVRGIHRSPVKSTHKDQRRGALIFSLMCVWINVWVNNREAGDLRCYRANYYIIVMYMAYSACSHLYVAGVIRRLRAIRWSLLIPELLQLSYSYNTV